MLIFEGVFFVAMHFTIVLLCWAVVVGNLRTDPPGSTVSLMLKDPIATLGMVFQEKKTSLSGEAQENSTIPPLLTFLDSGVLDSMTAVTPPA